ncbi:MAG: TerB family tellurite resistance protein [Cytophagales bacterium]|nr:TerB family tellurite resistance protein [Cytophagales bacterium]MDW8383252.1 TerB family tellurite resistance protein [Flammeovirgaceae bacterium]
MQPVLIEGSTLSKSIYHCTHVPAETWIKYAQALLSLAHMGRTPSLQEIDWFQNEWISTIDPSHNQAFAEAIAQLSPLSDISSLLPQIVFPTQLDVKRVLLFDNIRMIRQNPNYHKIEKENLQTISKYLQIPMYLAKTIDGIVSTEFSLRSLKRSIFEFDSNHALKLNPGEKALGFAVRETLGIFSMTEEMQYYYGCALMVIAGSDGLVSEAERNWFIKTLVRDAQFSDEVVEKIKNFNYIGVNLFQYLEKFSTYKSVNIARTLLYNAIKMAMADGDYADEEKNAVAKSGKLLNIPSHIVHTMEYLISTELSLERMRKTIFQIKD